MSKTAMTRRGRRRTRLFGLTAGLMLPIALLASCSSTAPTTSDTTDTAPASNSSTSSSSEATTASDQTESAGADSTPTEAAPEDVSGTIRILQTGISLGQAPYAILQEEDLITKKYPNIKVEWVETFSGTTANQMLLNGQVDAAIFAYAPFLIARDAGLKAHIAAAGVAGGLRLNTNKPYTSLADFTPDDQIASPGPTSIQAMLISMLAKQELGDYDALAENIITMPHPEAMQALISGQVAAHFAATPFSLTELDEPGIRTMYTGREMFGTSDPVQVNAMFVRDEWVDQNPQVFDAVLDAIHDSFDILQNEPERAAEILARQGGATQEELLSQMRDLDMRFDFVPTGIQKWADFMLDRGMIKNQYSLEDLVFPYLLDMPGIN